jgi:phosphatidylglycerol:prolipoprotein diacylglycerol transferase
MSGFMAWGVLMVLSNIKRQTNNSDVSLAFLIGICGGVVGAGTLRPIMKAVEVAILWEKYKMIPAGELLNYIVGEIVFYGGFIGGLVGVVLFCKKFNITLIPLFDLAAPALALSHAIGRMGCYFGGCCYGMEVPHNHPLSIIYPSESLSAPPNVPLLAIPLIEAGFLFVLFALLTFVYIKTNKNGLCALIYFLLYPIGRFMLEFYRGDLVRGTYGLLTTSQYISIGVLIFGIVYFILVNQRKPGRYV